MRARICVSAIVLGVLAAWATGQDGGTGAGEPGLASVKEYLTGIPESTWQSPDRLAVEARNVQSLCGAKDALPCLRQLMADPGVNRTKVLRIVAILKPEGTEAIFAESLNNGKTKEERETALCLLAENGSDAAMQEVVLAACSHSDRTTRGKAKRAVQSFLSGPRKQLVSVLHRMMASTSEPASARTAAMRVLETMPGDDVNAILLGQVDSPNAEIRVAALRALTARGNPTASRLMLGLLRTDPNEHVRRQAAYGVGKVGGKASIPKLIDALGDRDVVVQRIALRSLQGLTGLSFGQDPERWARWRERYDRNLAILLNRLNDEKEANVLCAVRILQKDRLSKAKVSHEIASLAYHGSPKVEQAALTALGCLGKESSIPILIRALSDENSKTVLAALHALGRMPGEREKIARAVRRLTEDQDEAVASAARKVLASLPPRSE